MVFQDQDIARLTLFHNHCFIQEQKCQDMTLSLYFQKIYIAYLAVLCSEGYPGYDMAYYSMTCPENKNVIIYVILITYQYSIISKRGIIILKYDILYLDTTVPCKNMKLQVV